MRALPVLVALLLPAVASAAPPKWVQVVATVGGSLAGEVVGAPLGALAYSAADPYDVGRCADSTDALACEGATIHYIGIGGPIGAALGGAGGAIGANALVGGNVRGVALASGTTALASSTLVFVTPAFESPVPYVVGAPVALLGVPTAAGIAAGSNPPREDEPVTASAPGFGVSASYTSEFKGIRLSGRW